MNKAKTAFTLVELLIVVSMIGILTGLGAKTWYTMERISNATNRNLAFTNKSQIVINRLTRDIRCSISAKQSDDALLILSQISPEGGQKQVSYLLEAGELVRIEKIGNNREKSLKVLSLPNERIEVTLLADGTVRLEVRREGRDRPLEVESKQLISFVKPWGGKR